MHISFELTLLDADVDTAMHCAVVFNVVRQQLAPPRLARVVDSTVRFTTLFSLCPSLAVSLSARLTTDDERQVEAAQRMCPNELYRNEVVLVFQTVDDSDVPLTSASLRVQDVLDHHRGRVWESVACRRQRLLDAGYTVDSNVLDVQPHSLNSVCPAFLDLCSTVRLSSITLCYTLLSQYVALEVEVQSEADVQLRGFHIQPRLRFSLNNQTCSESQSVITGRAKAQYTTAGSERTVECCADVTIKALMEQESMVLTGNCLDVMRMADILAAYSDERSSSALPSSANPSAANVIEPSALSLSSTTLLRWTLESVLARQALVPRDPPAMPATEVEPHKSRNSVTCSYDLASHRISQVRHRNLTLAFVDPSSSSSLSPTSAPLFVLNAPHGPARTGDTMSFRLHHSYSQSEGAVDGYAADFRSMSTLTSEHISLAHLLRIISMPGDQVPTALLHRTRFKSVMALLVVCTVTGAALGVAGQATCGRCATDRLLFFNSLAPANAGSDTDSRTSRISYVAVHRPVNRWLRLQCYAVLDPVIFPQLALLTPARCMEPLYQYVLCETEGGVDATRQQTAQLTAMCGHPPRIAPLVNLRPVNAVLAWQLHQPLEYVELPLSVLTDTPLSATFVSSHLSLPSSPASAPTGSSCLLVELAERSAEPFRECVDFLDVNSILYGLLPAAHSLPSVSAALTSNTYGRRALLSRYGAWSDVGLWSAELLSEWRRQRSEQFGRQRAAPHEREVYWSAIADLQMRVNRFLIRVMSQRKDHILPQLYEPLSSATLIRPHHSALAARPGMVQPVYVTVPDAVLELLLRVPPFHSLPSAIRRDGLELNVDGECETSQEQRVNASPHRADFAPLMSLDRQHSRTTWSLYMAPVFVYENEWSAGRGYEVDRSELDSLNTVWGQPEGEEANTLEHRAVLGGLSCLVNASHKSNMSRIVSHSARSDWQLTAGH